MERTGFMEKKKKAVLALGFLGMLMTVAFMLVRYISIARPIQEAQYDYALENRGLTCQIDNVEIDGKGVAVQGWIYLLEEEPEEVRYYVWLKETDSDHCVILHTQCETRVDLADSAIDELDHSMGGFEAAAPMLIIGAHRFLEKYTLSKWQQYWKDQVANWYGMFLHESQYLEPVMRDIEAMLQESQRNVNGTAILELRPLSFSTVGVESEDDLVKTKFGEYGEMQKGWTAEDAKGFIKVTSTPLRVYYNNHKDEEI